MYLGQNINLRKNETYTSSSLHSNLTFLLILWAFYISLRLHPIPVGGGNFKIQIPLEGCLKPLYYNCELASLYSNTKVCSRSFDRTSAEDRKIGIPNDRQSVIWESDIPNFA